MIVFTLHLCQNTHTDFCDYFHGIFIVNPKNSILKKGSEVFKMDVDVMQDASEIVHYDKLGIPLYIRFGKLSYYPNMKALCHWHEDIEFIYILTRKMKIWSTYTLILALKKISKFQKYSRKFLI